MHNQRWENERVILLISVPEQQIQRMIVHCQGEQLFCLLQLFSIFYLAKSAKLLAKYIFYQFLATSSAKMHEELAHTSTGNIREMQMSHISIPLIAKGFNLVFKQLQGWGSLSRPGESGWVISAEKSEVHVSCLMGQIYAGLSGQRIHQRKGERIKFRPSL